MPSVTLSGTLPGLAGMGEMSVAAPGVVLGSRSAATSAHGVVDRASASNSLCGSDEESEGAKSGMTRTTVSRVTACGPRNIRRNGNVQKRNTNESDNDEDDSVIPVVLKDYQKDLQCQICNIKITQKPSVPTHKRFGDFFPWNDYSSEKDEKGVTLFRFPKSTFCLICKLAYRHGQFTLQFGSMQMYGKALKKANSEEAKSHTGFLAMRREIFSTMDSIGMEGEGNSGRTGITKKARDGARTAGAALIQLVESAGFEDSAPEKFFRCEADWDKEKYGEKPKEPPEPHFVGGQMRVGWWIEPENKDFKRSFKWKNYAQKTTMVDDNSGPLVNKRVDNAMKALQTSVEGNRLDLGKTAIRDTALSDMQKMLQQFKEFVKPGQAALGDGAAAAAAAEGQENPDTTSETNVRTNPDSESDEESQSLCLKNFFHVKAPATKSSKGNVPVSKQVSNGNGGAPSGSKSKTNEGAKQPNCQVHTSRARTSNRSAGQAPVGCSGKSPDAKDNPAVLTDEEDINNREVGFSDGRALRLKTNLEGKIAEWTPQIDDIVTSLNKNITTPNMNDRSQKKVLNELRLSLIHI